MLIIKTQQIAYFRTEIANKKPIKSVIFDSRIKDSNEGFPSLPVDRRLHFGLPTLLRICVLRVICERYRYTCKPILISLSIQKFNSPIEVWARFIFDSFLMMLFFIWHKKKVIECVEFILCKVSVVNFISAGFLYV